MLSFVSSRLSSARFSLLVLTRRLLLLFLRSLRYLKSQRDFGDPFIAGMRGVSVVMGLLGTVVMPLLAKHVGLVRGGAWSLWFVPSPSLLLVSMRTNFFICMIHRAQIACLFPPLLTLYIGLPHTAPPGSFSSSFRLRRFAFFPHPSFA